MTWLILLATTTAPALGAALEVDLGTRVRRLPCDPAVRKDPKRLAEIIDSVWQSLPKPEVGWEVDADLLASNLAQFVAIESPTRDEREYLIVRRYGGSPGRPIRSILIHLGMPAVQALLDQLRWDDGTKEASVHREVVIECLIAIYRTGGEGRRMAAERIRIYGESLPPEPKRNVLKALDSLQLRPPPGKDPGKK